MQKKKKKHLFLKCPLRREALTAIVGLPNNFQDKIHVVGKDFLISKSS